MKDDRAEILAVLRAQQRPFAAPPAAAADGFADDTTAGDAVETFLASARRNSAAAKQLDGEDNIPAAVADFLREHNAPLEVVCEEELAALAWADAGIAAAVRAPGADDPCGVTRIVAAAADTGAMMMTDSRKHALTQSLLPPCHVAVVRAADIVPSMPALWRRLPSPMPRGCAFVCGPSRTGDIEQTLVLGAHGPVAVLVLVVGAGGKQG